MRAFLRVLNFVQWSLKSSDRRLLFCFGSLLSGDLTRVIWERLGVLNFVEQSLKSSDSRLRFVKKWLTLTLTNSTRLRMICGGLTDSFSSV